MTTSYFDEYDRLHDEMARRSALLLGGSELSATERHRIATEIEELREQAFECLPYGATTPNKGSDGRRYTGGSNG